MNPQKLNGWIFFIGCLLIICSMSFLCGCATIVRGTSQSFRVVTNPPGKSFEYNGQIVHDGDYLTVQKEFAHPLIEAGGARGPILVELNYNPDPLLLCDGALLLLGVVPGLVALGVDFGTGAWRDYNDPQYFYVKGVALEKPPEEELTVAYAISEPKGGPPPWAPAHGRRAEHQYRYYPAVSVYFDVERKQYFYCDGGNWVACASLPSGTSIDINSYVVLEMSADLPYAFHAEVVKRYPPGQAKKIKGKAKGNRIAD